MASADPSRALIRGSGPLQDHTTAFTYSGLRGLGLQPSTTVRNPRNQNSSYTMNRWGGVERMVDPLGSVTQTEWNFAARQPARVVDAEGVTVESTFDAHGNLLSERRSGRGTPVQASWTYHPPSAFTPPYIKNRVQRAEDFVGDAETRSYDARGNLTGRTRGGFSESMGYAANGDRVTHVDF